MSIATTRANLAKRLQTITGLEVHAQPPDAIAKMPVAVIDWAAEAADYMMPGTTVLWRFKVVLLLAAADAVAGGKLLDKFLEKSGDYSIKGAMEGGTGTADFVVVTKVSNVGVIEYNKQKFYGAEFTVETADTD